MLMIYCATPRNTSTSTSTWSQHVPCPMSSILVSIHRYTAACPLSIIMIGHQWHDQRGPGARHQARGRKLVVWLVTTVCHWLLAGPGPGTSVNSVY